MATSNAVKKQYRNIFDKNEIKTGFVSKNIDICFTISIDIFFFAINQKYSPFFIIKYIYR